jgi:predicted secreted protein
MRSKRLPSLTAAFFLILSLTVLIAVLVYTAVTLRTEEEVTVGTIVITEPTLTTSSLAAIETNATVEATLRQTDEDSNLLTVIVYDDVGVNEESFGIPYNADGYFHVGGYTVYVGTYDKDKISDYFIVGVSYKNTVIVLLEASDVPVDIIESFLDDDVTSGPITIYGWGSDED